MIHKTRVVLAALSFCSLMLSPPAIAGSTVDCPTLSGRYTLEYSLTFAKGDSTLNNIKGADFTAPSSVTVSSDGVRFLWRMENGSWHKIVIYDDSKAITSYSDSIGSYAYIQHGPTGWASSQMRYIPFPGVGLSDFPLVRSVSCGGGNEPCSGLLIVPGATQQGRVAAYGPATIQLGKWSGHDIITSCALTDTSNQLEPLTVWNFDDFEMFQGVPIAKQIRMNSKMLNNCSALFSLVRASSTALPDESYKIETYLKPGLDIVGDSSTNRSTSYVFNPKIGDLDAQREAEYAHDDQRQHLTGTGTGPNRTKTGVYALIALVLFGIAFVVRARMRNLAK